MRSQRAEMPSRRRTTGVDHRGWRLSIIGSLSFPAGWLWGRAGLAAKGAWREGPKRTEHLFGPAPPAHLRLPGPDRQGAWIGPAEVERRRPEHLPLVGLAVVERERVPGLALAPGPAPPGLHRPPSQGPAPHRPRGPAP